MSTCDGRRLRGTAPLNMAPDGLMARISPRSQQEHLTMIGYASNPTFQEKGKVISGLLFLSVA